MASNLIKLTRRHHPVDAPTALAKLSEIVAETGTLTDDDIRTVATDYQLPEASVYGIATFYDDLIAPRGKRHVRICTGTACFEAGDADSAQRICDGLGVGMGEVSDDGSVSVAETVCLGFCHSSPAVRDNDVIDAGPGVIERVIEGTTVQAGEPPMRSLLADPVLTQPGTWAGLRRALAELTPEDLLHVEAKAADLRGRGGAAFPAGNKWEFARNAPGEQKYIVANGDEGDPGSYIDKYLMEQSPELLLEGLALAGYAVGSDQGFVLVRSEYPQSTIILREAVEQAEAENLLGDNILGSDFSFNVTIVEGAGSYVVGEETALLACLQGLRGTVSARPPFPAERGVYEEPTVVNNIETLCNVPFIAAQGAAAFRNLSPGDSAGSKLVCFNSSFVNPGMVEVPFGLSVRELCEEVAGGLKDGAQIKAVQIGGPLGGILPASLLDTPFDFDPLAEVGCMVGHGSILAFDQTTDMRALAQHLLRFGAHESCGKCFPCRIGLQRAYELFSDDEPVDRESLEELLETLELGSLCAHGSGMPAPIRSLLLHFPDELGLR